MWRMLYVWVVLVFARSEVVVCCVWVWVVGRVGVLWWGCVCGCVAGVADAGGDG